MPPVNRVVTMSGQTAAMNRERVLPLFSRLMCWMVVGMLLSGCATPPSADDRDALAEFAEVNDPLEPTNRGIFEINRAMDRLALKPAATAYRDHLPGFIQGRVHDILANLRAPVIFFNEMLQGEVHRAMQTLTRFMVNSTIGLAGFMDMATALEMEDHDEDFGQTLAIWGVPEGPFLMLPFFGPSNPRDTVGMAVDFLTDPLRLWSVNSNRSLVPIERAGTQAVDGRAGNLDLVADVENSSLDFYAAIRSLYRQRRQDAISNGRGGANRPAPGISEMPLGPVLDTDEELSRSALK